jgi:hypothetical protein
MSAAVFIGALLNISDAQEGYVSLFGIRLGSQFTQGSDYRFIQEDASGLSYLRTTPTNPSYLLQSVLVSPLSHIVVRIDGRTASGPEYVCQRTLQETRIQLKVRYPSLKERVDDAGGMPWYLLSVDRHGCFLNETAAGLTLHLPCSASFMLHCERLSNAFVIEASDTEYRKRARDEVEAIARSPDRNHLD